MHAHGHATGMRIAHLDMCIDNHRAFESHTHPDGLPSSVSSSSSLAISGSGLRSPTVRRQAACLPNTMVVSFDAKANANNGRLTGKAAFPKRDHGSGKRLMPSMPSPGNNIR